MPVILTPGFPTTSLLARLDGLREPWGQSHQISGPASQCSDRPCLKRLSGERLQKMLCVHSDPVCTREHMTAHAHITLAHHTCKNAKLFEALGDVDHTNICF